MSPENGNDKDEDSCWRPVTAEKENDENDENDESRPVEADGDFHPLLLSNAGTALTQAHLPGQMETWKDGISLHGSLSYSSIQNELFHFQFSNFHPYHPPS